MVPLWALNQWLSWNGARAEDGGTDLRCRGSGLGCHLGAACAAGAEPTGSCCRVSCSSLLISYTIYSYRCLQVGAMAEGLDSQDPARVEGVLDTLYKVCGRVGWWASGRARG